MLPHFFFFFFCVTAAFEKLRLKWPCGVGSVGQCMKKNAAASLFVFWFFVFINSCLSTKKTKSF
jgi:hypothetical protein